MALNQIIPFLLVSIAFIAIPGPNILVIVSTSLSAGKTRGLQTVMGTSLAMAVQLLVAALATGWLLSVLAESLLWIKWAGVAYLLYLGLNSLFHYYQGKPTATPSGLGSFQRGLWVSLTNPKTILFFSAFLPQFVNGAGSYFYQLGFLSLTFWILAIVIDSSYALLAARLNKLIAKQQMGRIQHGSSGVLYLLASGFLASTYKV